MQKDYNDTSTNGSNTNKQDFIMQGTLTGRSYHAQQSNTNKQHTHEELEAVSKQLKDISEELDYMNDTFLLTSEELDRIAQRSFRCAMVCGAGCAIIYGYIFYSYLFGGG